MHVANTSVILLALRAGDFVGRAEELARLDAHLDRVRASGRGRMLNVRGRRQLGKSRLVTEFVDRAGVPQLFFTATRPASQAVDLKRFTTAAASSLPGAEMFTEVRLGSWEAALRQLTAAVSAARQPSVAVIDEFPWLVENDPGLEGSLQQAWDQLIEDTPVLLVLIGSNVSMMEALSGHDRPLYGRMRQMVADALSPADTSETLRLGPADAIDAYLLTGGYPRLLASLPTSSVNPTAT